VLAAGASGQTLLGSLIPYISVVWDGMGGNITAAEVTFNYIGELVVRWANISVPAGGQVALLHYLIQQTTSEGAQAAAERLLALPPEGLAALAGEEIATVDNWQLPASGQSTLPALPPARAHIVSGLCYAGDGQTPASSGTVSVRSDNPLFGQTFSTQFNNGTYTLNNVRLPDGPFTVTARRGVENFQLAAVANGNADAVGALTLNITFAGTGAITGLVLGDNNQPMVGVIVRGAGTAFTGPDGRFSLAALPPTVYLLSAQSGNRVAETFANVPSNGILQTTLSLPRLGTVNARVTNPDGSPAPDEYVTLKALDGPNTTGLQTDADGRCIFTDVLPGSYRVNAPQPGSGQITQLTVQVVPGETVDADLTLAGSGLVTGRVMTPAGVLLSAASVA
jgi:hypothetical protein